MKRGPTLFDAPEAKPERKCACGRSLPMDRPRCGFCEVEAAQKPWLRFDGTTYEPERDRERLGALLNAVRNFMRDSAWHTLPEIHAAIGGQGTEASISARLRDLRKRRFGGYRVERRRRSQGLYEYRVLGAK